MTVRFIVSTIALLCTPLVVSAAGLPWYAGVSGGVSSLRPDTDNSAFELDSSVSGGAGVFVGYDFSRRISFEAGFQSLGNATLTSGTGESEISYSAISAGGLYYFFGDSDDIAERTGFTGYARLGLSSINNDTDIPLEEADNVAIWLGAGVEWAFTNSLSLRGELTSFDGDAQAARLAIMYRPSSGLTRSTSQQAPSRPTVVQSAPQQSPQLTTRPLPAPTIEQPKIQAPIATETVPSDCAPALATEPRDAVGCGLFSGPLRGVEFASGTGSLTSISQQILDRLSVNLLSYPGVVIEIQAHTESFGNPTRANNIARERTIAVARYLASKGVPVTRLRARAFGHSAPVAADNTVGGRRRNNRIELLVVQ